MSRWKIKASTLIILSCVLFVMLLIVVLPDVDLLDTAFHRDTAPVVIHAQATSAPAALPGAPPVQLLHIPSISSYLQVRAVFAATCVPNFLPIFLHSIRR
jgi:hypothetical protein